MFALGIPADLMLGWGSRNFWGATGGVLFVAIGSVVHKRRTNGSPSVGGEPDDARESPN